MTFFAEHSPGMTHWEDKTLRLNGPGYCHSREQSSLGFSHGNTGMGQLTTASLVPPACHCQVAIGQHHMASSLQGQLATGEQTERQAGERAGGQGTKQQRQLEASHFHTPCCYRYSCQIPGWRGWCGVGGRKMVAVGMSNFYISHPLCLQLPPPSPFSLSQSLVQWQWQQQQGMWKWEAPGCHCRSELYPPIHSPACPALPPAACSELSLQQVGHMELSFGNLVVVNWQRQLGHARVGCNELS